MNDLDRIIEEWVALELRAYEEGRQFPSDQEAASKRLAERRRFKKSLRDMGLSNLAIEILQLGVKLKGQKET